MALEYFFYTFVAMFDHLFGPWGNSPAVSWGITGMVLGTTTYFVVNEARKLSWPTLSPLIISGCIFFLILAPFIGPKTGHRNVAKLVSVQAPAPVSAVPAPAPYSTFQQRAEPAAPAQEPAKPAATPLPIESVEDNSPRALFEKGRALYDKDPQKAASFYIKAAEKGYVKAQRDLGALYQSGSGVTQDYAASAKWYRKAAENGDAQSQYFLSYLLYKGLGVDQNSDEARQWLEKAARHGHQEAKKKLAKLGNGE